MSGAPTFDGTALPSLSKLELLVLVNAVPTPNTDGDWASCLVSKVLENDLNGTQLRESVLTLWRLKTLQKGGEESIEWSRHCAAWIVRDRFLLFDPSLTSASAIPLRPLCGA